MESGEGQRKRGEHPLFTAVSLPLEVTCRRTSRSGSGPRTPDFPERHSENDRCCEAKLDAISALFG
jgi:hypothetical protein